MKKKIGEEGKLKERRRFTGWNVVEIPEILTL
jgi:hypothetical protein